jgi:hypothetical protein
MKLVNIFLTTALVSAFFFGCKKKNYKEAELLFNMHAQYSLFLDTTRVSTTDLFKEDIFKIKSQSQLDSLIPVADGMLNHVDLTQDVVFVFNTSIRSGDGGPELKGSKVKINDSENEIEFSAKIKGYDGQSSSYGLTIGFLIIPKEKENYSVSGTVTWAKVKFLNWTGSTNNVDFDYSYKP